MKRPQRGKGPQPHPVRQTALLVLIVVAIGALLVLGRAGRLASARVSAENVDTVLLVASSTDDQGAVFGSIIALLDVAGDSRLEALDPFSTVSIPGTSYSRLGDVYPFQGGAGVATFVAKDRGVKRLPYLAVTPQQLRALVDAAGDVSIAVPAPMSVFDGERLYTFDEGSQDLDGAELEALLKGAPYLPEADRASLRDELARVLVDVMARSPERLADADSNLDDSALSRLAEGLKAAASP